MAMMMEGTSSPGLSRVAGTQQTDLGKSLTGPSKDLTGLGVYTFSHGPMHNVSAVGSTITEDTFFIKVIPPSEFSTQGYPSTFDSLRADAGLTLLPGDELAASAFQDAGTTVLFDLLMSIRGQAATAGVGLDSLLSDIRRLGIAVPDTSAVLGYLASRAPVATRLSEACRVARATFGLGSSLSLEVDKDPESGARTLAILVRQPSYGKGFVSKLQSVAEEVEALFPSTSDWVLVTSDFAPPSK